MTEPTPEPTHIEVTVAMWDQMQKAQDRAFRSLVRLVLVIMLVFGAFIGFISWRSYESQQRQSCITTLTGDAFGRAFEALAAPPAPNPARGIAVKQGLADARKLENIDRHC